MSKVSDIKYLLATGSDESRKLLAPIIHCFDDTMRLPNEVADELEKLLEQLPDEPRALWSRTVKWLRD